MFGELYSALEEGAHRIRQLISGDLEAVRFVGKQRLPSKVGGLLVHIAEHTQRHVGQAITTSKIVRAQSESQRHIP